MTQRRAGTATDTLGIELQRLLERARSEWYAAGVRQGREDAAKAIEADGGFDYKDEQAYAARIARGVNEQKGTPRHTA